MCRSRPDLPEHVDHFLVGAAVTRSGERRGSRRDHRVGIGERAAHHARRGGGAVLLVIGVQDEEQIERLLEHRVGLVLQLGHLEEHREEVAGVGQVVVGVDVGQPAAVAVGERGDGRHLADQASRLDAARLEVHDVLRVGIERGQRADRSDQHAHRVRVVAEALHEALQVLVHHRVHRDVVLPHGEVARRRQLALDDQIRGLEIRALLRELLDGVAAVAQDAAVAVDVGDLAPAGRGVHERRVVAHQTGVVGPQLDAGELRGADGAVLDRERVLLAGPVVLHRQRGLCHGPLLPSRRGMVKRHRDRAEPPSNGARRQSVARPTPTIRGAITCG